ncbi:MAG TPA: hypothetical protein DCF33_00490, partial [Saprospirales bacterium]|nr:hypothetical protein [Saprospirales bacterium]
PRHPRSKSNPRSKSEFPTRVQKHKSEVFIHVLSQKHAMIFTTECKSYFCTQPRHPNMHRG